ncbi:glycosyltransferase [Mangrovimonas xylaniphaga]|uniref:glycosyltransferase n=1 Tax=Mangrovimonas xylaniphaga TaxID=1645915 RepID=UPI0006B63355|nr:glycosyltransferase [Mangrovimonas xylaniphaga]
MKVLLITNTPPIPSWGGAMTFFRHFCEKGDFEIQVVTDNRDILNYEVPYRYYLVNHGNVFKKLSRTRFAKVAHTYSNYIGVRGIHSVVKQTVETFKPDAIFTVAGSWSWMAILAQKVSEEYQLPLVGSFNDWWNYNSIYYPSFSDIIEYKFRKFYQKCDLVLCTSEGMFEELGEHRNCLVSYPTGTYLTNQEPLGQENAKKTLAFGGNLGDWYGTMIEAIITNSNLERYDFKVFGSNASWSAQFDVFIKQRGYFKGQVPFEVLQKEMLNVDGLLLLMGFGSDIELVERTSFKTKFLDYLTFRKPIFLWGPNYCTAYKASEEFDATAKCASENVKEFVKLFDEVLENPKRQQELLNNSLQMYQNRFHPDLIHKRLVEKMKALI